MQRRRGNRAGRLQLPGLGRRSTMGARMDACLEGFLLNILKTRQANPPTQVLPVSVNWFPQPEEPSSRSLRSPVPQAKVHKLRIPNENSQAKGFKRKIPNARFQTKIPKRKILNKSSQVNVPKRKFPGNIPKLKFPI